MNTPPTTEPSQAVSAASKFYPTFFLCLFLGVFGVHRFYTGKIKSGVVQLLTCGGLGIWCFIDMVMILLGKFKDKNGVAMPNINPKLTWAIFVVCVIIGIAGTAGQKESAPVGSGSDVSSSGSSSDATETVNEVTRIGTYEGTAEPRRVMGVLMTGKWTVAVFKHKNGVIKCASIAESVGPSQNHSNATTAASIGYDVDNASDIRSPVAAEGGAAFRRQAGERRRRASSIQLTSPPVATRNGLACLPLECAILTHRFCHAP